MNLDIFMDTLREMFEYNAETDHEMPVSDVSTTARLGEMLITLTTGERFTLQITKTA